MSRGEPRYSFRLAGLDSQPKGTAAKSDRDRLTFNEGDGTGRILPAGILQKNLNKSTLVNKTWTCSYSALLLLAWFK